MTRAFEPNRSYNDDTSELDLGALWRALARKKRWIFLPTLAAFVAVGFYVTTTKPMYTADSQVLLENQESFVPRPLTAPIGSDANFDEQFVGSQIQLLTSRDLARRVIEKLSLVGNPDLDPAAKGLGTISRILVLLRLQRDPTGEAAEERVVDTFAKRLTVFSPLKTRVLTIEFQAHDPVLAARIANEIVSFYIEAQSDAKRQQAKTAAIALAAQITELRGKLSTAADAVENYRTTSGLLAGSNNMTITGQQLVDLNSEISKARTEQADAQAKAGLIREMIRTDKLADIADVASNELVRRIAEQRVSAKAELALESRTLLPEHPRIKELNAQIADLDMQLRMAAATTARTLETNSRIAAARVANLQAAMEQQKGSVARANVDQVHLHELERVAQAVRDQLDTTLAKYQEATARETSPATPADARIIARAAPPDQPSYPKKLPMLAFGTAAALVFSTAAVVASELLADPAQRAPDLPPRPDPLAPARQSARRTPTMNRLREFGAAFVDSPPSGPSGARVNQDQGVRIVATSVATGERAAAALLDFARSLVRDGRPILIDLNAESDDLANLLHSTDAPRIGRRSPGLTDVSIGAASIAEVIHRDAASRLHFIGYGSATQIQPADLDVILEALAQTYDFIVLAAPALAIGDVAKSLVAYADFVVLVGTGATKARCEEAYDELLEAGAPEVTLIGKAGRDNSQAFDAA
jgi:uncharacterized protein involved in exopolysaccharide biosynthesis